MASVYFSVTPITGGVPNMWVSDGTETGTVRFEAFEPFSGGGGQSAHSYTPYGGLLAFTSSSTPNGAELWATNGTVSGTYQVANINTQPTAPGSFSDVGSQPRDLAVVNGRLVFFADNGVSGPEPWVSNGAPGSATLLRDIVSGPVGSFVVENQMIVIGNRAFFPAGSDDTGYGLWITDGTPDGTMQIAAFERAPTHLFSAGGLVHFGGYDPETGSEPWVSDGTAGGTRPIGDLREGVDGSITRLTGIRYGVDLGGLAVFTAVANPDDSTIVSELWASAGGGEPYLVHDFRPDSPFGSNAQGLTVFNGEVWLTAYHETADTAVWRTNGTDAGTHLVLEGSAFGFTPVGQKLFFGHSEPGTGDELWVHDAETNTTYMVMDIRPGMASGLEKLSDPFIAYGGGILFGARSSSGSADLWFSDGTAAGTHMVKDLGSTTSRAVQLTLFGDARFTGFNNIVALNDTGESVEALGGDDFVTGGEGDDSVDGGLGADTLVGGKGNDTLDGGANPEGGTGQGDVMLGGEGDDTYHVDSGLDLVDEGFVFPGFGFGGFDTIISTTDFYWDTQSVGEVLRVSEDVNDVGGDGVTIVGGIFDNTLVGHSGTDVIFGRGGSDIYRAGDGIDFMSLSLLGLTDENAYPGVNGVNTVIVEQRQSGVVSYDIVFEFERGRDRIDVSDYASENGLATGADVIARAVDDGAGNVYIPLGDGLDYLYLVGVVKAQLLAGDFIV